MANSTANRSIRLLAASLPLWLGGVAQAAAVNCQNQDIVIDARPGMEMDYRNNNAILRDVIITQCDMRIQAAEARVVGGLNFENGQLTVTGDVRIAADGGNLTSDKAVISFRDRVITRATITGSPAQFEQKRDDGNVSRGRAGTIDYLAADGTVSFNDDAWITTDGKNEISGRTFVYNIRLQRMEGQPKTGKPEKSGNDRIRIVIPARKPGEKEQEKNQ